MFIISAVKVILKFSATLFVISNQFTNIEVESNVINAVLPEADPVEVIV